MVREVYGVHLSVQGKARLKKMIRSGRSSAQAVTRARILLKTDEGWTASQVAAAFDVSERTVRRAKRRYVEEGLEETLRHHNSPTTHCKVDEKVEAHPVSITGLDLNAEPNDQARPLVCFDESSTQLLAETKESLPAKPGRPRWEDYKRVRCGTRNLFLT